MKTLMRSVVAAVLTCGATLTPAAALDRLTVGTPPAGLVYNQIGTAISSLYQEKTGVPGTARPFGGTTAYMPLMQRGEIEAGVHGALESNHAFLGDGNYPERLPDIRALGRMTLQGFQYFVRSDSGMTAIPDLAGAQVINRMRGLQGFDPVIDATLASGGLTEEDFEAVTVGAVPDGFRSVIDGRADASITALGIPPLREADAAIGVRMLTLGEDETAVTDVPGLEVRTVEPGPAQPGVIDPIRVAHMSVLLNASTHMSEDDAYELIKVVHENWGEVQEAVAALRGTSADEMVPETLSHPFHDGAVRYFEEVGLWTDAHQEQQDALLQQ